MNQEERKYKTLRVDVEELKELHQLIRECDDAYFQLPPEQLAVSKWPRLRKLLKKIFPVVEEDNA